MSWRDELAAAWWPGEQGFDPTPEVLAWLTSKHDAALRIAPASIGEIGVRTGYCAFAMLSAAPTASYLGFDLGWPGCLAEMGALAREQGAIEYSAKLLARFRAQVVEVDSHAIRRLPPFDLLHIDGDHTFGGLAADLELAWRSGVRWVLVDDYLTGCVVGPTTDAWAGVKGIPVQVIDDGFRGSALLDLDAAAALTAHEDGTRREDEPHAAEPTAHGAMQ